jgi:D-tyrosyl-tRNA(Tyr) deacylase
MIVLLQRVAKASVSVDGSQTGAIGRGLLLFVGIEQGDSSEEAEWLARKCTHLRVFGDENDRMNHSLLDVAGEALVVSQFTLCGDTDTGNRPSFTRAAPPDHAEQLYHRFIDELDAYLDHPVAAGEFGAMMDVELINDGPVTFWVERKPE